MIILVASQKGGTGKSITATNIAAEFARLRRNVVIVDADPQGSTARWHADREEAGVTPRIECVKEFGNIRAALLELDGRFEIVVVDVAGKDSNEMRTGMTAAHKLLVPVRPSQFDLDTLPHMRELIDKARKFNPDLEVRTLLTQVPTHTFASERTDAVDYLSDYPDLRPLKTVTYERKAYRDVTGEGLGVVEWTNRKAKTEVQNLVAELMAS
jgi:chromosome partitioning protein